MNDFWGPEQIQLVNRMASAGYFPVQRYFARQGTAPQPMPHWLCYSHYRLFPQWPWDQWRGEWMGK